MNIGNISNIILPKTFLNKNVLSPAFKSQPIEDTFVRSTDAVKKVESQPVQADIPEYLYHMTSAENYAKIMETGTLRKAKEAIDGVFMVDMSDFQKNWRTTDHIKGNISLAGSLLSQAAGYDKNGVVILKIPTKNLDQDKIRVRKVMDFLEFVNSGKYTNIYTAYAESGGPYCESAKSEYPDNVRKGYPIGDAKKLSEEGNALEFIYTDNIDLEGAEVVKLLEVPNITKGNVINMPKEDLEIIFDNIKAATEEPEANSNDN